MELLKLYFRTIKNLGFRNCVAVLFFRILLKLKFYKFSSKIYPCSIPEKIYLKNFKLKNFKFKDNSKSINKCLSNADKLIKGNFNFYGSKEYFLGKQINWFFDYKNKISFPDSKFHWSESEHLQNGDIKECWEISRWNWAPKLARAFLLSGDFKYLNYLNDLVLDWCLNNSVNGGVNWICGQEISIRLINALITWKLIESNDRDYPKLLEKRIEFVAAHLKRINQTTFFARAQNNNHWISESAALFIGGNWLLKKNTRFNSEAIKWASNGRSELEKSVKKLVMKDGSFTQHSLTYHRFVIDILSQVELWRTSLDEPPFSIIYQKKFTSLINWLYYFVDEISGDGPNLGANDGTFCFQLHEESFRDFRPTLQLSSALNKHFENIFYPTGKWDEPLEWYELNKKYSREKNVLNSKIFLEGGYVLLKEEISSWGLLRLPKYHIRPSQNDPFHFDLWHNGLNLLRDGGSFSYNNSQNYLSYFNGIKSHNSIEFLGNKQMITLSRFLLANKINFKNKDVIKKVGRKVFYKSKYTFSSNFHERKVTLDTKKNKWEIIDHFISHEKQIILRWRLLPTSWNHLSKLVFESSLARISIESSNNIRSCKLIEGIESRFYSEKSIIPVVEIIVSGYEGKLKTLIDLF